MRRQRLTHALAILILVAFVPLTLSIISTVRSVGAAAPVLTENFKNNAFNSTIWKTFQDGNGPTAIVVNDKLQVTIPSNSTADPATGGFSTGLSSLCVAHGNFDMQVNFQQQVWPPNNGVRSAIGPSFVAGSSGAPFAVERVSFSAFDSFSGEFYLTHLQDGIQGVTPAHDTSGTLRVTRIGSTATGYYLNGTTWVIIHSGPDVTTDVGFGFGAGSESSVFARQTVQLAFSNFTMTSGQLQCPQIPRISLTPTSGPIGTLVTVKGSGFPTVQSNYPITQSAAISFENMSVGNAEEQSGRFNFSFDVPLSQPGIHTINAIDYATGTHVSASFDVTSQITSLSVTISIGSIYFPRDTAEALVLISADGVPVTSSGLILNLTLTKPDNSQTVLSVISLGNGLFRSSYAIPATTQIGTYSIEATARMLGVRGSSLATFEVKLPWLSSQGQTITVAGLASLAAVGVGLVGFTLWRRGSAKKHTDGFV